MGTLLVASLAAGTILGLVFFWGLWATVDGLDRSRHPALRMAGSLLLRFGLVLGGFALLARYGGWQHTVAAVFGFMVARMLVVRRVAPGDVETESDA